jgi:16S rRNA (cytidine1402-2'-O)-methyltransferase
MTQQSKSPVEPHSVGTLFIVATPIGNLSDMSFRAVETLKAADVIACEDTRVSRVLCHHYGITTHLIPYHDHNSEAMLPQLLERIARGERVALISDAGTPLISDPGYKLVNRVVEVGARVIPIPGASSLTTALCAAGLPTDRVHFSGFLPAKQQARLQAYADLASIDATLVLFESNHRLSESLQDALSVLGNRAAVVARELTKHFEELRRGTLEELFTHYNGQTQVKGEIVLLIAPPEKIALDVEGLRPLLTALLAHYPVKVATSLLADTLHVQKKQLYDMALEMKST